ncbi:MAG: NAD-dependent malic enzyme [Gammaproteobacteria bacterium RIFCSPHIGHO2_12_FULL_41_20]|nr:MAG: NAD-dependent malic enzyme [Gammaproteobacteria bacterium RIFCSPHIGHO2_12_FULL_41_20]
MNYKICLDDHHLPYLEIALSDYVLISNPLLNKGMAFSDQERHDFNLFGLLPPHVSTIDEQRARSYEAFKSKKTDIEKYLYLRELQDSNETLFYNLVCHYIAETMPIVYTPTVGLGCQQLSHIYRRPRGVYIAYPYREHIDRILAHHRFDNVKTIVVSDGERILGLGDQGAGGMGIPIGKLALYTACAGIHPSATLPILLDTGTDNTDLVKDPLYIGWRHPRVRGKSYDHFIDLFVTAVKKRFPHVLLQWEDFAQQNANPILARYHDQLCTFNDDIQGTAAVTVGALLSAVQASKSRLRDQRIVVVGAGSAGCGISSLLVKAIMEDGLSAAEACKNFFLIDRNGLLIEGMSNILSFQKSFVQSRAATTTWKLNNANKILLEDVVHNAKPTILIGVCGQPHIFTQDIIVEMAKHTTRPIIFPLSNPSSRCEAIPTDLMHWTNEQAIIGTGSPFGEIVKNKHPFRVDQVNNSYIFPGLGLGLVAVQAKRVTDEMFMAAAKALANNSPAKVDPDANLLPPLTSIRDVSLDIAVAVAEIALASGLSDLETPPVSLRQYIKKMMFVPEYLPYKKRQK